MRDRDQYLRWLGMRALLSVCVALFVAACSKAQAPLPASEWTKHPMEPPVEAALGVLSGEPSGNTFSVRWLDGTSSVVSETDLLESANPWRLPTLGPLHWPAVFAVESNSALVWGKRGWGWATCPSSCGKEVQTLEQDLHRLVEKQASDVARSTNTAGVTQHHGWLMHMPRKPVYQGPDLKSPVVGQLEKSPDVRRMALTQPLVPDEPPPINIDVSSGAPSTAESLVLVVELRGEWALVSVPRADVPSYIDLVGYALVAWTRPPVGWVRMWTRGPVPGSRIPLWNLESFGFWP